MRLSDGRRKNSISHRHAAIESALSNILCNRVRAATTPPLLMLELRSMVGVAPIQASEHVLGPSLAVMIGWTGWRGASLPTPRVVS